MKKLRVLNALKKFSRSKPLRLAMPGHKGKRSPKFDLYKCDVTELPAIDNENVVKKAEADCAKILGATHARFLTGGSSEGVMAMLYAVKHLGKKIAICRSSHKSVYNGLKLLGIEPVILESEFANGAYTYPSLKNIEKALSDSAVIGILFTYPDYYGKYYDIKKLQIAVKAKGKLLLIDGAHGGHYKFVGLEYAGSYADLWVDGLHKTMPTLNQGAIVCCNDKELIARLDEGVNLFSTTSPSYPILASVEYGVKFMAKRGGALTERFNDGLDEFKIRLVKLGVPFMEATDVYKLAVDFGGVGYNTDEIEKELIKRGIHAEMNDGRYILFMFSAYSKKKHLKKLYRTIKSVLLVCDKGKSIEGEPTDIGKRAMQYIKAVNAESEPTELKDAVGKIVAENAGLFPPCYPAVVAGERITDDTVKTLSAKNVFGVVNGKIKTVKE